MLYQEQYEKSEINLLPIPSQFTPLEKSFKRCETLKDDIDALSVQMKSSDGLGKIIKKETTIKALLSSD